MTYGGTSWREHDDLGEMAAVLSVVRQLHEMLAHLDRGAAPRPDAEPPRCATSCSPSPTPTRSTLLTADLDEVRGRVSPVLREATVRLHGPARPMPDDLAGADLRGRGPGARRPARIAADRAPTCGAPTWRGPTCSGADLRDADVRGARLADAWFLTQAQLNTTRGDAATTIPERLVRPDHWG